jgi:NtrC-family two-component system sensor histidine kinase KinB
MKIKNKLRLNVGLLFLLILILGSVGIGYIHALKRDTDKILVANYQTLEYCINMLSALDDTTKESITVFEENLFKQEANITEPGEKEATINTRRLYTQIKASNDTLLKNSLRNEIRDIMKMNMKALKSKSLHAQHTAKTATLWIALAASLCILIAFSLMINLPSNIANPISELTKSIRQIADRNYSQRVHFNDNSEFGDLARSFNTMAEKLEEYNDSNLARLLLEKKRIETLISNMRDPVIGIDEQNNITFINKEALKITGLQIDDVRNKTLQRLSTENDLIRKLTNERNQPKGSANETLKIFNDGKECHYEKTIVPISIMPTGETKEKNAGIVILLRNVTAYKELDAAKTNFLSTISHEFKTPISAIKMGVQLLYNEKTGTLNKEQHSLVEGIKDDAERLLRITGELLKMTQVESGNIQLSMLSGSPIEIVNYAVNATKIQADQKKLELTLDHPMNLPNVIADREKTAWVLTNLISNAIRYSTEGSEISISVKPVADKINFEVRDFGKGIAPDYLTKIFDRYFRVPGTSTEGTGLGLSISKDFIEAQGGTIGVESTPGEGSRFYFQLPSSTDQ